MMATRDINDLYEPLKDVVKKALEVAKNKGLNILVYFVKRTAQEQRALYSQGRNNLKTVNALRAAVGFDPLTEKQNRIVTWTLRSYHTTEPKAMAFDFAPGTSGNISWNVKEDMNDNDIPDYKEFADICKSIDENIEWGGDWDGKPDFGHIQWKNGINIKQNEPKK
jgi:hypothetical protein